MRFILEIKHREYNIVFGLNLTFNILTELAAVSESYEEISKNLCMKPQTVYNYLAILKQYAFISPDYKIERKNYYKTNIKELSDYYFDKYSTIDFDDRVRSLLPSNLIIFIKSTRYTKSRQLFKKYYFDFFKKYLFNDATMPLLVEGTLSDRFDEFINNCFWFSTQNIYPKAMNNGDKELMKEFLSKIFLANLLLDPIKRLDSTQNIIKDGFIENNTLDTIMTIDNPSSDTIMTIDNPNSKKIKKKKMDAFGLARDRVYRKYKKT